MKEYHIIWEIDVYANSAEEAAKAARAIQERHDTMATVFDVIDESGESERIDLQEVADLAFAKMWPHTKAAAHILNKIAKERA